MSGQLGLGRGAHPRAGGENHYEYAEPSNIKGSSPRVRGKLEGSCACFAGLRLIPARAGKTVAHELVCVAHELVCVARGAHPRAGGENLEDARTDHLHDGSSPRGRGKPWIALILG